MPLPENLPSIRNAPYPVVYEQAKQALQKCDAIDECKDWSDKAAALRSYARQAHDKTLFQMAMRIQARAVRRCGELLKTYDSRGHRKSNGDDIFTTRSADRRSRKEAASGAGLSLRQKATAIRVAAIAVDDFESAVESENPPTITELADRGRRPHASNGERVKGWDRKDYTYALLELIDKMSRSVEGLDPNVILRGMRPAALHKLDQHTIVILSWFENVKRGIHEKTAARDRH